MESRLTVQVNEQLTLDAGTLVADTPDASHGTVRPPVVPMFEQVLTFLDQQPAEPDRQLSDDELAQVTVTLCLRYGTWFALLSDEARLSGARLSKGTSRIDDPEMARINVEASAALARWLDLRRERPETFRQLALRALRCLPAQPGPFKSRPRPRGRLSGAVLPRALHYILPVMTVPDVATKLVAAAREMAPGHLADRQAQADEHPSRVLSNALINATWRNGPVEELHSGRSANYPLNSCRLTPRERDRLLRHTMTELKVALPAIEGMIDERGRTWPEKVLAFNLLDEFLVTPSGWTLTETSWEMRC